MKPSWPQENGEKIFFTETITIWENAKGRRYMTETTGGVIKDN